MNANDAAHRPPPLRLPASQRKDRGPGLAWQRAFAKDDVHPFDEVAWERRAATITNMKGDVIFEQRNVEMPAAWSQTATAVVVSKYFRGTLGAPEREDSVRQLIGRVVGTIGQWARDGAYFASDLDRRAFEDDLTWLLLHQCMAFNSPVWFNVGVEKQPQCSACFINSVEDTMESILSLAKTEGMLFKFGSGTGSNLSPLRSSREQLAGGGLASGPVSFMKGFDAFAGVIKSGGKTRRAAKMVILDIGHPDIVEFIRCKEAEEKKALTLIQAGYDGSLDGEAYASVFFQNSNNSVRVPDEFMRAVQTDASWETRAVRGGRTMDTYRARELFTEVARAAWACGDPGMQFDTTINEWHTCPNTDRIHASNPCSEYMFLDDSACNLASLNLMKFVRVDGEFDAARFQRAVDVTVTAQEILVDFAAYPTPRIEANSHAYRPLGLGYANLGALLMTRGLAYDSDGGRAFAGAVTALMHGEANLMSARLAAQIGTFPGYVKNREPMVGVMRKHRAAVAGIDARLVSQELMSTVRATWDGVVQQGEVHGFRNAQVTVLAPTGTIAFMMDCDTTGIEPDIALVKYKKLVGGGTLKIVNNAVPTALTRLGYDAAQIADITGHIDANDTIEGAPGLKDAHLPVFDCAFKPANGTRSIAYMGHLKMMAAAQPFLSGAISKTVNLPTDATVADLEATYLAAWQLGVKAVAIYRDGCKSVQPLSTKREGSDTAAKPDNSLHAGQAPVAPGRPVETVTEKVVYKPLRRKLPDERQAITHKFSIAGHEGYITVGLHEDGAPGEVFIRMAKEGSTLSGMMDAFATAISLSLQYGVPLQVLCDKFTATRFEPSGFTPNKDVPYAKSITDYIFRWLALKFLTTNEAGDTVPVGAPAGGVPIKVRVVQPSGPASEATGRASEASGQVSDGLPCTVRSVAGDGTLFKAHLDSPLCSNCGRMMFPSGACYRCDCGATSGGCS
ncbi:MAG: vitamin B12-dependent ribonucleotide reductase [Myxococcales bacterium]|nr:vitamin B12-dependent ribonucleotide reductase [Myxococcales bacterium]